jgi:hypothetical protein
VQRLTQQRHRRLKIFAAQLIVEAPFRGLQISAVIVSLSG